MGLTARTANLRKCSKLAGLAAAVVAAVAGRRPDAQTVDEVADVPANLAVPMTSPRGTAVAAAAAGAAAEVEGLVWRRPQLEACECVWR